MPMVRVLALRGRRISCGCVRVVRPAPRFQPPRRLQVKRLAIVLPTAAAAASALALMAASGSAQTPGTTLQVFEAEKGSTFGFVDNPLKVKKNRVSVGDAFAFNSPVLDQARATRLGVLSVQCTATTPGKEKQAETMCTGAFRSPTG